MVLGFVVEHFYGVFRDGNSAVWPAQWFLVALASVSLGDPSRLPWIGDLAFHWLLSAKGENDKYARLAVALGLSDPQHDLVVPFGHCPVLPRSLWRPFEAMRV